MTKFREIDGRDLDGAYRGKVCGKKLGADLKAAELMGRLSEALMALGYDQGPYADHGPAGNGQVENGQAGPGQVGAGQVGPAQAGPGQALEVFLVRVLYCLFAQDTGLFPRRGFGDYLRGCKPDGSDLSERLGKLFESLGCPRERRERRGLLSGELKNFGHADGGLFLGFAPRGEFDSKTLGILLECAAFDWSAVSPAIFGSLFQGVMNQRQRRETGAHYTSEENILKVIKPLFLDDLWEGFYRVKANREKLVSFHEKISGLKFLDPACGCGDFLIVAYRELRLLELGVLRILYSGRDQKTAPGAKVNLGQFYGFEIEDFPCQIAQIGLGLMDYQLGKLFSESFGQGFVSRFATGGAKIVRANALRLDWEKVVTKKELSFIFGNPPFAGYSNQSPEQKADIVSVFRDANGKSYPGAGKIDYAAAWFFKAAKFMEGTDILSAFVSTTSITQGEQAPYVWKPLFEDHGTRVNFAYRVFKWSNQAKGKALVFCVIVGFGQKGDKEKVIFDGEAKIIAKNINAYLIDGPDVFIGSRSKAICDVPSMVYGNKPTDGGFFFLGADELEDFLAKEPGAARFVKRVHGAKEYINDIKRYCLWLVGASPPDFSKLPLVLERVEKVRKFRLSSPKKQTRESASRPWLFQEIRATDRPYIIVPCHSSEIRKYIPLGFVSPDVVPTNAALIIPGATLYHFGVLTSMVHMAWVRVIGGRIGIDYRYSKDVVYNNFPWPKVTDRSREEIAALAQGVLEARAQFPNDSLADLYDPKLTPPALLEAHDKLDCRVMKSYGFKAGEISSEEAIVAKLMVLWQKTLEGL
ncbi:MAG: class I SAM-dependent DNA methyltransferase [Deltaproteobacteria bacterium]|jgi:hypothetical protein|nr:class I SAM-dependent DNA methyltransferase [Deltaproteobacteria bacterium]